MADEKQKYNAWMEKPFLVVCDKDDRPVAGCDTREAADQDAADRNARAKALGIAARYEVESGDDWRSS